MVRMVWLIVATGYVLFLFLTDRVAMLVKKFSRYRPVRIRIKETPMFHSTKYGRVVSKVRISSNVY